MLRFSLRWNLSHHYFADSTEPALAAEKGSVKAQSQSAKETKPGKNAYPFREPGRIRPVGRGGSEECDLSSIAFP
jgi:hypothetical protein